MTVSIEHVRMVREQADCLFTREQVEQALAEMARGMSERLHAQNPILLCVMNGGLVPLGKLLTYLDFPLQVDYIHATRYRGATEGGRLHWLARPHLPLTGRAVLVVDDILDEGVTLDAIMDYCREQEAAQVYSAVLVEKRHARKYGVREADFVGLQVEDRYVFGYGMDYKGYLRNAPGIYAVKSS